MGVQNFTHSKTCTSRRETSENSRSESMDSKVMKNALGSRTTLRSMIQNARNTTWSTTLLLVLANFTSWTSTSLTMVSIKLKLTTDTSEPVLLNAKLLLKLERT